MITKKIHYCWFGMSEKPKLAQKCIASWKKYCPDYEIIEWNENNFDVNMNGYTRMCYEQKKYAFLTDYARLVILEEYGGIYFDTDVEVIRSFDDLLDCTAFFGFENENAVASGLGFGAEPHTDVMKAMVRTYDQVIDGKNGVIGCPILNTEALIPFGLIKNGLRQSLKGIEIYPPEYFNPYSSVTGRLTKTQNTHSIHWYSMSWGSGATKIKIKITRVMRRIFGERCFDWLKRK